MAASTSTAASSNTNSNYHYDIFINHRGPDTKKSIASYLYRRLVPHGFRVFLDLPELQVGETITNQIERVIESGFVHIAIFSRNYAESPWCLDELVQMLRSKAIIIPVFYDVKPSDLRIGRGNRKDGVYGQSLQRLANKRRYDPQILENWSRALLEVSNLSGFELEAYNGDEGELVEKIVQQVQKIKARLDVATYPTSLQEKDTYPTSLDEKLEDFERTMLLQQQQYNGEARVVGIVGFGGVGKTTLAKEFFNRKRSDYQHSCFLFDVREAASRSSLNSLQNKLIKDLISMDLKIDSISDGKEKLSRHLSACQALIILDNVDLVDQLNALFLPLKDVLSSGSLILVTCRDKDVLTISEIEESSIYKMTGLDPQYSQELFCLHAFEQPHPPVGFAEGTRMFLDACHGLPLYLKVLGALLYLDTPNLDYWKAQLDKLSKAVLTDVQLILQISYDNLDIEEKEIFLDIACFFIGMKMDTAIRVWDGSGWQGYQALRNLEKKCLIELDSKSRIRMHDNLRNLGRDLADKEPLVCQRRLWRPAENPFHNQFHQSSVRGITMVQQKSGESLGKAVKSSGRSVDMSGLQLLRAHGDCLGSLSNMHRQSGPSWLCSNCWGLVRDEDEVDCLGIKSNRPKQDLLWLRWDSCPYSSLPPWIPVKNLRVLELGGSSLVKTLWDSAKEAPLQLMELNIGNLLRLPKSIGLLKQLEKIDMKDTTEPLPEEFFQLHSLKYLRLQTTMKSLPDSLRNLTSLRHIDLSRSTDLECLPISFGNLTNLRRIELNGCCRLQMLPESFGKLTRLEYLSLAGCDELTLSSKTFGDISKLTMLDLSGCQNLDVLPAEITDQRFLEEIDLSHTNLRELPADIGNLSELEILKLHCPLLERLPSLNLTSLTELTVYGCQNVKCLPDSVGRLKQLRTLMIANAGIGYLPVGVMKLNKLEFLSVIHCPLQEVPFASQEEVERGHSMFRLKQLDLRGTNIKELSFAEGVCPQLKGLDISGCAELLEVRSLPTTLISLKLKNCNALKNIRGLPGLGKLHITS